MIDSDQHERFRTGLEELGRMLSGLINGIDKQAR